MSSRSVDRFVELKSKVDKSTKTRAVIMQIRFIKFAKASKPNEYSRNAKPVSKERTMF